MKEGSLKHTKGGQHVSVVWKRLLTTHIWYGKETRKCVCAELTGLYAGTYSHSEEKLAIIIKNINIYFIT